MIRDYEAFVILKAVGTEAEMAQSVAQIEDTIKKLDGHMASTKPFGRRRLAYRIGRQSEGHYQLLHFRMAAERIEELKRVWRLNESLLRFLILADEPALAGAQAQPAAVGS